MRHGPFFIYRAGDSIKPHDLPRSFACPNGQIPVSVKSPWANPLVLVRRGRELLASVRFLKVLAALLFVAHELLLSGLARMVNFQTRCSR